MSRSVAFAVRLLGWVTLFLAVMVGAELTAAFLGPIGQFAFALSPFVATLAVAYSPRTASRLGRVASGALCLAVSGLYSLASYFFFDYLSAEGIGGMEREDFSHAEPWLLHVVAPISVLLTGLIGSLFPVRGP